MSDITEKEIREILNEGLGISPQYQDSAIKCLLSEIDRMRENASKTLRQINEVNPEVKGQLPDPVFALCVMAVYWKEQASKLQKQIEEQEQGHLDAMNNDWEDQGTELEAWENTPYEEIVKMYGGVDGLRWRTRAIIAEKEIKRLKSLGRE